MTTLHDVAKRVEALTFDCYGTLIDWRVGLARSFRDLFGPGADGQMDDLQSAYLAIEAEVQTEVFQSYRRVVTEVAVRLAKRFGFDLPGDRAGLLAEQLPTWAPFADTNEALARLKRRHRLGVLSNVDRDLFAGTARHFDVAFDFVVAAEDVGAYKPSRAHFERLLSEHAEPDTVLHVAQSLYHDGVPAGELGIPFVWINRYDDRNDTGVSPLATFPDLKSFADAMAE